MDIVNQHMKHRCCFLTVICGVSVYNIINYSSYDPTINDFWSLPYQHCLFTMFYFLWDTYYMTISTHSNLLYRKELVLHHIISITLLSSIFNYFALQSSCFFIMECISLMNYAWRDKPLLLKFYRTCCIFFVRIPISVFTSFYYEPLITHSHLLTCISKVNYYYTPLHI